MRVTVDTNVLISALLFEGKPAQILELAQEGKLDVVLSPFILGELEHVLHDKFGFSEANARDARLQLEVFAEVIDPKGLKLQIIRRKDSDNRILECAIAGKVEILITGNMRDLRPLGSFKGIPILTPNEFLSRFGSHLGLQRTEK